MSGYFTAKKKVYAAIKLEGGRKALMARPLKKNI